MYVMQEEQHSLNREICTTEISTITYTRIPIVFFFFSFSVFYSCEQRAWINLNNSTGMSEGVANYKFKIMLNLSKNNASSVAIKKKSYIYKCFKINYHLYD